MNEKLANLVEAANDLLYLIDRAGLQNLSNGVQLGSMAWFIKTSDAVDYLQRSIDAVKEEDKP